MRRDARRRTAPAFVVLTLMFAWFGDTGGYFAGRFLGKHKLYEAVCPKKTVEGAIGGLAGSVVGALLAHFWFLPSPPARSTAIVLALVAGALGQAGDLGESLLKRSIGVKDSGGIVPGHGGILDRVDALLVTSTVTYLYALWVRGSDRRDARERRMTRKMRRIRRVARLNRPRAGGLEQRTMTR